MRGSWRLNKDCNILTPTLMAISVVPFLFSSAAQPETRGPSSLQDDGFLNRISSLTHLISNSSDLQLADFLSTPSYIIVQSPTQSLEWHVWPGRRSIYNTTTPGQSGPGSNGNEGVPPHCPDLLNGNLTTRYSLASYTGHSLAGEILTPLQICTPCILLFHLVGFRSIK